MPRKPFRYRDGHLCSRFEVDLVALSQAGLTESFPLRTRVVIGASRGA